MSIQHTMPPYFISPINSLFNPQPQKGWSYLYKFAERIYPTNFKCVVEIYRIPSIDYNKVTRV